MRNPKVSVIMSVYKEPIEWLHESIDSILNQTFSDFEFIIICDNPDYKEGIELLEAYKKKDNRIVIVKNEQNIGLTKSLNKGLAIARGEYIARMDADDISVLNRFAIQLNYFKEHPEVDLCHTAYVKIDEKGRKIGQYKLRGIETQGEFLLVIDRLCHPSVMFRSKLIHLRNPFYDPKFTSAQDYDLWSFLLIQGITFGYIDDICIFYRVSSQQISNQKIAIQVRNGKEIRRHLICSCLEQCGITGEIDSPKSDILKLMSAIDIHNKNKVKMQLIKYMLYVNLAKLSPLYSIYYFTDKSFIFQKMPLKFNLYVLFRFFFKNRWRLLDL